MLELLKTLRIIIIACNFCTLGFYLIGMTSFFQHSMGLIETVVFLFYGLPSFVLSILSVWLGKKGWHPQTQNEIIIFLFHMMLIIALTAFLIYYAG